MSKDAPQKLNGLAYRYTEGKLPCVVFLGGFKSDMGGTKAVFLEEQCRARGQAYLRFDYSGHGQSDGDFEAGTIGIWKRDALAVFDHINPESAILVGSSMGGWIALLVLLERPETVMGVVGIAAAPDFMTDHYPGKLSESDWEALRTKGRVEIPTPYGPDPYVYTKALYDDAPSHYLLDKINMIEAPVTLIQGMADPDVPWEITAKIQAAFKGGTVDVVLIEDGDHRLSRPEDLAVIDREVQNASNRQDDQ